MSNRPVNFNDPTGHKACGDGEAIECDPAPKLTVIKKEDKGTLITKDIGDFYVGPNTPKDLTEYEAESYGGHGLSNVPNVPAGAAGDFAGLIDDQVDSLGRLHNQTTVSVSVTYRQFDDGSINVLWLTIANGSDVKLFVESVTFTAVGNPMQEVYTASCNNLDQCYSPDPRRLVPTGNDSTYFATINPRAAEIVSLTPSNYPMNPNNHFGPPIIQTAEIRIRFIPSIYRTRPVVTYNFFP